MNISRIILLFWLLSTMNINLAFSQVIDVRLPSDTTGTSGTSITIPIVVSDLTDKNVIAYQAVVTFDENVLEVAGASSSGTLSRTFGPPTVNTSEIGKISVGGFGTSPLSGVGSLVNLLFDIVGKPSDTTALIFDSFVFNAGDPAATTHNGKFTIDFPTGISQDRPLPKVFKLHQNYPNPFNPQTNIIFEIPTGGQKTISLSVFNIQGQLVMFLAKDYLESGKYKIVWDGKDSKGNEVPSGLYIYTLTSGDLAISRSMLLVR